MKLYKLITTVFIFSASVSMNALIPPDNRPIIPPDNRSVIPPDNRPRVDELLDKIENYLDGSASEACDFSNQYEEAYDWLLSNDGLNFNQQEASITLDKISDKSCPALYYKTFRSAYTYAFSKNGLDKNRQAAIKFATSMADNADRKSYTKKYLDCYKKSYNFQFSALKKPRLQAEQIAESQCFK